MAKKRSPHLGESAVQAVSAADAVNMASGVPVKLVQPQPEPREQPVVTNIRIRRDQLYAVQDEAILRARARGGKVDQSAIYREAVDLWIQTRKR